MAKGVRCCAVMSAPTIDEGMIPSHFPAGSSDVLNPLLSINRLLSIQIRGSVCAHFQFTSLYVSMCECAWELVVVVVVVVGGVCTCACIFT